LFSFLSSSLIPLSEHGIDNDPELRHSPSPLFLLCLPPFAPPSFGLTDYDSVRLTLLPFHTHPPRLLSFGVDAVRRLTVFLSLFFFFSSTPLSPVKPEVGTSESSFDLSGPLPPLSFFPGLIFYLRLSVYCLFLSYFSFML